jgi:hypothetical protein
MDEGVVAERTAPAIRKVIRGAISDIACQPDRVVTEVMGRLLLFGDSTVYKSTPSNDKIAAFARQAAFSSRRLALVEGALREFERCLSNEPPPGVKRHEWKPFKMTLACDWHWTSDERDAFKPSCFPHRDTGVYVLSDNCPPNEPHGNSTDERYAVVRYIGRAMTKFSDPANSKRQNGVDIRHRWIDVIPVRGTARFLIPSLEVFLLERICTTDNDHHNRSGAPVVHCMLR